MLKVANAAMGNSVDVSTYANIEEVYATHIDLDILVDFDRQVLEGTSTITFTQVAANASSVWLDAEGLYITNIEYGFGTDFRGANYYITRPNGNLGDAVEVLIPTKNPAGSEFKLIISYVTNDRTTAISWLKAS